MRENRLHHNLIFILILIICGAPIAASAQTNDGVALHQVADSLYLAERIDSKEAKISPWNFHTTLGSSFYFAPGYGAGSNVFAAPHLNYSATNRLSFHGGFVASQNFPLYTSLREDAGSLKSFTNLSMFVAASYQVTKDLVVFGTGMRSMIGPGLADPNNSFSMDDLSFGAAYSFGNFTIGASFQSGYSNSYGNTPFNSGRGLYPSPFYW